MIASLRVTFQKKFHVVRTVLLFQSLSRVRKDVHDTYDAQIQADHVANVNFKAYDDARVPSSKALSCKHERLFDLLPPTSSYYSTVKLPGDEENARTCASAFDDR